MIFCLYFLGGDDAFDDTVGSDDERGAERTHIFSPVHRFFAPDTEFFDESVVGIADQRKGQGVLIDEALV